jgi:membrane-associated protease RseP (regulator of RpoE activity)
MDSTPGPSPRPVGPPIGGPLPGTGTELVGLGGAAPKEMFGLPVLAELPTVERPPEQPRPQPREPKKNWRRGIILFVLTCASMWLCASEAAEYALFAKEFDWRVFWALLKRPDGPLFMFAMMGILFSHEMGHFLQSLRYRVAASVPYFIPMPISPIGTMGAVIFMGGRNRNRKELFDIGLSGPWAGLFVAIPILIYGVLTTDVFVPKRGQGFIEYPDCLLVQWLVAWLRPELGPYQQLSLSPLMRAGWGAMLLTGLNMLPIGQLDGGHVAYALFRKRAHWIARIAMMIAGVYIVISRDYGWSLMYILALLMRPDHPATHDDSEPIGWPRWVFGFVSLFIPVICLAPLPRL